MRRNSEPPTEATFSEAVGKQLEIMRIAAQQLDTRGYCLLYVGQNKAARQNNYIYKYFSGAFDNFVDTWAQHSKRRRRYPVVVWVFPDELDNPINDKMTFMVQIPDRQYFKIINIALGFISQETNSDKTILPGSLLTKCERTAYIQYRGGGRKSLRALLKVLEIPAHKQILLTGDSDG